MRVQRRSYSFLRPGSLLVLFLHWHFCTVTALVCSLVVWWLRDLSHSRLLVFLPRVQVPRRASEPPWKTPQDADSRGLVINLLSVAARGFTWKGNHLISRTLTGCASRELQIVVYIMGLGPSQADCYLQVNSMEDGCPKFSSASFRCLKPFDCCDCYHQPSL